MISFVEYTSGAALFVRIRNSSLQYLNFGGQSWAASESANTKTNYSESTNGDGTSLYVANITIPAGGPFIQEAVLPSGEVIAYDTTAADAPISAIPTTPLLAANYTAPPTITAIRQEMDSNSTKLANLDVAVSSRPSATAVRQEMDSNSTKLANLDVAVSSRSTFAGGAVASVTGSVGSVAGNVYGYVGSVVGDVGGVATPVYVTGTVTVGTNNDKTGYSLSTAGIMGIWNIFTNDAAIIAGTLAAKIKDLVLGNDKKVLISSDAQDIPLKVTAKTVEDKAGYALTAAYDAAKTASSQSSVNAIPTTPLLAANYVAPDNAGITVAKNEALLARQLQSNKAVIAPDGLSVTIYEDDGVTPLWVFATPDNKHRTPV